MVERPKCECGNDMGLHFRDDRWICGECLYKKIARLEAIVDTLPKTADGVLIVPGMTLWCVQIGGIFRMEVVSLDDLASDWPATVRVDFGGQGKASTYRWHVQACYSTRKLAEEE